MKFLSKTSLADNTITIGRVYFGSIIWKPETSLNPGGVRIVVFDNFGVWRSFDPQIFIPYKGEGQ